MRNKIRAIAVGMVSVFVLVAAPVAFVSADQTNPQADLKDQGRAFSALAPSPTGQSCFRQSAGNAYGYDITVGTANYGTYSGTTWQDVNCTGTSFNLKYGQQAIVVSNFNAESDCQGTSPTNGQWCLTRALLNGAEGSPVASDPDSFAYDSVAGTPYNWQANSMQRSWNIRCGVQAGCKYKFVVQTRMHDSTVSSMWLDDISTHLRVNIGAPVAL